MARKGENIFKRGDGRWEGRYIKGHEGGRAIYGFVFGKSYTEVKEKKMAAIASMKDAEQSKHLCLTPTMEEVGRQWLDDLKSTRKLSTVVKYANQLDSHIYPILGNKRISDVSNEDMIVFIQDLLTKKKLSTKSASDVLSRMKSIRKYALIHGYEVGFVPECVIIPQKATKIRVLSFAEEEVLVTYLNEHPDLTSLGILICLFTGIRIGELCALTWSDISLSEQELHVRRTMQRLQNLDRDAVQKTYISIDEPKSKCSIRTIPIPDNIMDAMSSAYVEDAYLLTGHKSYFIEPRTMKNRFKAILKACGISDANYHACRHTFATRCVEAGFDIEQQSLEFAKYTLDPWVSRWEQSMVRSLLTAEEKNKYFIKFNVDELLRGDYKSRMDGYAIGRQNGWMSANDIRELENLDRIPAEEGGDLYLINGNMTKLKDAGAFAGGMDTEGKEEETDEEVLELEKGEGRRDRGTHPRT